VAPFGAVTDSAIFSDFTPALQDIFTAIRLRHDYDEKLTCLFFARVESRRMKAGARDTS